MRIGIRFVSLPAAAVLLAASLSFADDSARLLRVDHYVRVHSTVPAISGQTSQIYVREVVQAGVALRGPAPIGWRSSCTARARPPKFPSTFPIRTTAGWLIWRTRASTRFPWI